MSQRRVVITGVGAVCAAGVGSGPLMDALYAPASCTRKITGFVATGFHCHVAGEIPNFSARDYVPKGYRKAVKVMARDIELAVVAADQAVRDSGLITKGIDEAGVTIDGSRFACNIGSGLICADLGELGSALQTSLDEQGKFDMRKWGKVGMTNLTPLWLLKYLPNMLACHVTIIHDMRGPSNTITCGEASSHLSVGEAWHQIVRGSADYAIAGGAESKLNPMGLIRQGKLGRLNNQYNDRPAEACRPFDADHAGTIIGEGGGLLILEELELAKKRGAKIYAEIVGFAGANDPLAVNPEHATCGNFALAARKALQQAGIAAKDLGLVIPNGSAVPAEDNLESAALADLFGSADVPVTPILGSIGNCYAGAGGLSLVVAAESLHRQKVPCAVNYANPAAGCRLNVPKQAMDREIRYVLSHAFSNAGQSAAILLKRYEND